MADVALTLVPNSYLATKRKRYSTEVVRSDNGETFRNSMWSAPLSQWDVTIPFCRRSAPQFLAAEALFDAVLGSGLSFWFRDPAGGAEIECCIVEDTLASTPNGNTVQLEFSVEAIR